MNSLSSSSDGSCSSDHLFASLLWRKWHRPGRDFTINQLQLPVVLFPPRLPQDRQFPEGSSLSGHEDAAWDVLKREAASFAHIEVQGYPMCQSQSQLYWQSFSVCVQTERIEIPFPTIPNTKQIYVKICLYLYMHNQRHIYTRAHIKT